MPDAAEAATRDPSATDVTQRWSPLRVALVAVLSIFLLRLLRRWWRDRAIDDALRGS